MHDFLEMATTGTDGIQATQALSQIPNSECFRLKFLCILEGSTHTAAVARGERIRDVCS